MMNFKTFIFFVFIFIYSNYNYSQNKTITWSPSYKLKFTDFKGKPNENNKSIAQTGANIIIVPYAKKKGKYLYKVVAKFYMYKSWIKSDDKTILNHEQLHFDIAELYARKMRRSIANLKNRKGTITQSEYRQIHKKNFADYIDYQKVYDKETRNSINSTEQIKWQKKVHTELNELNAYKI